MLTIVQAPVVSKQEVAEGVFLISFDSEAIANNVQPGQFINILVHDGLQPLLRRPFSVSRCDGSLVEIVFNVVGVGTRLLSQMHPGDRLDILGPLGKAFTLDDGIETALIAAGGLGVAPFPLLTSSLAGKVSRIETFLGARTAGQITERFLENVHVATDDGSRGFHGTVVRLLESYLGEHPAARPKIFGCGPTPMLKALANYAVNHSIPCELSLEGEMACGVGICQGCPVRRRHGEKRYALVCTDGPAFDCRTVILDES